MVRQARPTARRARSGVLLVLLVSGAAVVGVLGSQSPAASSSTAASPTIDVVRTVQPGAPGPAGALEGTQTLRREQRGTLGEADGVVPDNTTVFDDRYPGIARLDGELLAALRHAATDAAQDGIQFVVDSGWRSANYQERLFRQAVSQYRSVEKAAELVAVPGTSAHESGEAVDIGHADAIAWLAGHGAAFGLCQIYGNEPWHYELRPEAIDRGCPTMYATAAQAAGR